MSVTHLRLVQRPELLVSKHELAREIGFSERWIEQRMKGEDPIPHLRFGRAVRFVPSEVSQWLERGRAA